MLYLADLPAENEIIAFYSNYSGYIQKQPGKIKPWALPLSYYTNPFIAILLATGGIRHLSICEIGCLYGFFLELVKYGGGEPYGVELDETANLHLSQRGIPNSRILDPRKKYDVICLFQVLEHLVKPSDLIASISQALNPDGRLLISVPNGREYDKVGYSWVGFRVDLEHVNYFDLGSLAKLFEPYGLLIEHFCEHAQPQIGRLTGASTLPSSPLSRALLKGARTVKRLLWGKGFTDQGSFVLTALARKAHPNKPA